MLPDGADRWNVARPWTAWIATLRHFVPLDHKETLYVLEHHPNSFRKMAGSRVRDKRGTHRRERAGRLVSSFLCGPAVRWRVRNQAEHWWMNGKEEGRWEKEWHFLSGRRGWWWPPVGAASDWRRAHHLEFEMLREGTMTLLGTRWASPRISFASNKYQHSQKISPAPNQVSLVNITCLHASSGCFKKLFKI